MIPLDTGEQWPQVGRGGWKRNRAGRAIVSHPDGGKRTLEYRGASDYWIGDPYDGPSIHGERGSFLHSLCDLMDAPRMLDDNEMVSASEQAVALGIPLAVMQHIAATYADLLDRHGIEVMHVEIPVVNDELRVATNVDRVVRYQGDVWVADIKSSANVETITYAVQLAASVGAVPYDQDTDTRGEWGAAPRTDKALLVQYQLAAALKAHAAGEALPDWRLHVVDLTQGHELCDTINTLRAAKVAPGSFALADGDTIAAPSVTPLADVEQPDEGAGTHGKAPAPSSTLAEFFTTIDSEESTGTAIDVDEITATIRAHRDGPAVLDRDQLRARHRALSDADKREFDAYCERNEIHDLRQASDEQIAEALDAIENFRTANADPVPRPAPQTPPVRPTLPTEPDEGIEASDEDVQRLKAANDKLDDAARSWLGAIRMESKRAGVSIMLHEQRTARRYWINKALIALAHNGFDNADAVRGCAVHAVGAEIADSLSFTLGQVVGCMSADQALTFYEVAATLAEGHSSMSFLDTGACRVAA